MIKNIILITTGSSETDEARGEEGARTLCITDDQLSSATHQHKQRSIHEITAQTLINEAKSIPGILQAALPALEYIPRTPGSLRARRVISMIFPLAELFIIGYLIYVGRLATLPIPPCCNLNVRCDSSQSFSSLTACANCPVEPSGRP